VRFPSGTNERLSPIFWESLGDFGSLFVDDVELKEITAAASPAAAGKK
jgi:hypothetical protein